MDQSVWFIFPIGHDKPASFGHMHLISPTEPAPRRRSSLVISVSRQDLEDSKEEEDDPIAVAKAKLQFQLCDSCKRRSKASTVFDDQHGHNHSYDQGHLQMEHQSQNELNRWWPSSPNAYSTHRESLVGSYEESLFSKRLAAAQCSQPILFTAKMGVIKMNPRPFADSQSKLDPNGKVVEGLPEVPAVPASEAWPKHISCNFQAVFYQWDKTESTAYVGDMDIRSAMSNCSHSSYGYKIPRVGQLQIVVSDPQKTRVHLFLVPYNLSDMPARSKSFIRLKVYTKDPKRLVRAVHIPVVCPRKSRLYIYNTIRLVFNNSQPRPDPTQTTSQVLIGGVSKIGQYCANCV